VSLEGKIHELWAADATLNGLLPVERVFTGRIPRNAALPCARIDWPAGTASERTTDSLIRSEQVRISIWAAGLTAGKPIQRALEEALANRDFPIDDDRALDVRHTDSYALQSDDPQDTTWQFVSQFQVTVTRARTAEAASSSSSGSSSGSSGSSSSSG